MSNKRITDLTELTNPTTDDVLPIVDIATNTTQKVQVGNLPTTTAVTNALATKQDTLVSGTNIKTLNSTSLLGSGDIVLTANPSGVSGAIQFSNGSAFASDATNLFWDDTNNRLGIGTNAPSALLNVQNSTNGEVLARFKDNISAQTYLDIKADPTLTDYTALYFGSDRRIMSKQGGALFLTLSNSINMVDGLSSKVIFTPTEVQIGTITGARLGVKGSGSTSATTSLLVQNSSGSEALKVRDDGTIFMGIGSGSSLICDAGGPDKIRTSSVGVAIDGQPVTSAALAVNGTSKGFLPPRMTTTQKNAIATPASGLVVYDTTTNKLCCYNGSTWNDLF